MATKQRGYSDSYHQSRINHLAGTGYPATITTPYVGLYLGSIPLSDGSGNTDNARVAVTWAAAAQDPNTGRWYTQPSAALTFTPTASGEVVGFGVYSASSGGNPVYADQVPAPFAVAAGKAVTLPASTFRVFSEGAN